MRLATSDGHASFSVPTARLSRIWRVGEIAERASSRADCLSRNDIGFFFVFFFVRQNRFYLRMYAACDFFSEGGQFVLDVVIIWGNKAT